jgi:DNA-binding transcriptional LysR family regulator
MEMNSVELLKRMVELAFGAAVVPGMAIRREVADGRLRAIPIDDTPATRAVGLALPRDTPLSHAAQAFATLVQQPPL